MFERALCVDLAVFKNKNFSTRKQDAVAFTCWCEVDAQTTGHRHRLVPRFDLRGPIGLNVCCFLNEGGGLIPRLAVPLLHGSDQFIRIRNLRVGRGRQYQQKDKKDCVCSRIHKRGDAPL